MEIPIELQNKLVDLSNYEKGEFLGKGKFGKVYLTTEKSSGKQYAAKILNEEVSLDKSSSYCDQDFDFSEFQIMASNSYPALLGLTGFSMTNFVGDPHPTIIYPLMTNNTVKSFFNNIQKTNTRVFIILLGIAIGMRHLHSKNIVHRDLKSDNVLLDENFYPYIADFGFSKQGDDENFLFKTRVCTPLYGAPEIFRRKGKYDKKVDVFSFSILAYQLLLNKAPYDKTVLGYTFENFSAKILKNELRPETDFIRNTIIKSFLERCWSPKPDERPSFDQIIKEMTEQRFYSDFGIIITEVIKYLDVFGSEFEEIKNKLITDNNININDNDSDDESCNELSSDTDEDILGLTYTEMKFILRTINVSEQKFIDWARHYHYDPENDNIDMKRKTFIDHMTSNTIYDRKVITIIYDYNHPRNQDDDIQTQIIGVASMNDLTDS
ncbi:hypothetical protein M9Y10_014409 [Tritrichomonas musculus]|uniref:Protein kinase domain-containing protein n=1 Tax=Tritrichomonas musculus TaxID=1915356 RepID=A0ABR2L004_9EUKA